MPSLKNPVTTTTSTTTSTTAHAPPRRPPRRPRPPAARTSSTTSTTTSSDHHDHALRIAQPGVPGPDRLAARLSGRPACPGLRRSPGPRRLTDTPLVAVTAADGRAALPRRGVTRFPALLGRALHRLSRVPRAAARAQLPDVGAGRRRARARRLRPRLRPREARRRGAVRGARPSAPSCRCAATACASRPSRAACA